MPIWTVFTQFRQLTLPSSALLTTNSTSDGLTWIVVRRDTTEVALVFAHCVVSIGVCIDKEWNTMYSI